MQVLSRRTVTSTRIQYIKRFPRTHPIVITKAMDDGSSISSSNEAPGKKPRKKIDGSKHPFVPKAQQPSMKKNPDGSWGPTGLYGARIKETKLLGMLRSALKPSRLKRVEEVLQGRSKRVQCLFENLHDPANGAACLRTMEGFGVLMAHAIESYEPFKVPGGITMNAEKVSRNSYPSLHTVQPHSTSCRDQCLSL